MSRNTNRLNQPQPQPLAWLTQPGNWRPRDNAPPPRTPSNPMFPRPSSGFTSRNVQGGGSPEPRLPVGARIMVGPLGLGSSPVPALPLMDFLLFHDTSRFPPNPTPWFIGLQAPPSPRIPQYGEELSLSQEDQNQALKMLKKGLYNPTPKKLAKRLSLYYRDNTNTKLKDASWAEEEDEDGKRCAVCLDDFEPREVVVLTPCNHMFHEDCIVPWVKSHAKCPVCRFAL